MIERLLPATAVLVEADERDWDSDLWPEESRAVARAAVKRRREFASGRACARRALSRLGVAPGALLPGPNRAPLWPDGVVGSITHCTGYCAAAVGRRRELKALGIDAELNEPLPAGVAELVCTEAEVAWMETAPHPGAPWQTVIFSAKESVYKAWQPLTGAWLGYLDAELTIAPGSGAFEARLLVPPQLDLGADSPVLRGRFALTVTHVFTAVALPAA